MRAVTALILAVLLAIVVVASACSDTVSEEAASDVLSRCEDVPAATLDLIETGLTIGSGELSHGAAVKSDCGPDIWIVAAQVNGDGFEDDRFVGIWAVVTGIEADAVEGIAVADDFTRGISTRGDDLGRDLSSLIDGVSAAGACVTAEQQD